MKVAVMGYGTVGSGVVATFLTLDLATTENIFR